jgi:hypothetical protein
MCADSSSELPQAALLQAVCRTDPSPTMQAEVHLGPFNRCEPVVRGLKLTDNK